MSMKLSFDTHNDNITISFCRKELSYYFSKLLPDNASDAIMRIVLELENASTAAEGDYSSDDSYSIELHPHKLHIKGSNNRSILLAIYRMFYELGCRFPFPDRALELIPRISYDSLHLNIKEKASYRHRGFCIEGADSLENILNFIDWLPKIGCNTFFVQHFEPEFFLKNWYQHKYNPQLPGVELDNTQLESMFRRIDEAIARRSLLHHRAGHGWTNRALNINAMCVPEQVTLAPEQQTFLAEINNERKFWQNIPSNTNLCYANPEVQKKLTDIIVTYAEEHPEISYLHIWLADEFNNICECQACKQTTLSDQYLDLLNKTAAAFSAKGLTSKMVFLLYQELLWPPTKVKLEQPERFTLMFAPISRTFMSSYADRQAIPERPLYKRNKIKLPATLEENLAFLQGWQEQVDCDSFVYDYPLGRAHYGDLGYKHMAKIIYHDVKALDTSGLNGYISCQELRAAFPNSFPEYVLARCLWNKNVDFEALEKEYFEAVYGPEASAVSDYLNGISAYAVCDYFNGIGARKNPDIAALCRKNSEFIEKTYPLIRRAYAGAEPSESSGKYLDESATRNNLEQTAFSLLDYHYDYAVLLLKALIALAEGAEEQEILWQNFMSYVRTHELQFQAYLDVYRILEVATKYTGFTLDMPR